MKSKRSFTLIELLLVISVIAILSGMLLPTLAKIKEKITMTMCLHNLKQNANGIYTYSGDFDGMGPNTACYYPRTTLTVYPYRLTVTWNNSYNETPFPGTSGFHAAPLFAMLAYKYWPANKQLYCESHPITSAYDWRRVCVYLEYIDQIAKNEIRTCSLEDFVRNRKTFLSAQYQAQDLGYPVGWQTQRSWLNGTDMACSLVNGREFNPASSATPYEVTTRGLRLGKHPTYGLMLDARQGGSWSNAETTFSWHNFRTKVAPDENTIYKNMCKGSGTAFQWGLSYYWSFTQPIVYEDGGGALLDVRHAAPGPNATYADVGQRNFYYFRRDNVERKMEFNNRVWTW